MTRSGRRIALLVALLCWPGLAACSGAAMSEETAAPNDSNTNAVRGELISLFSGEHPGQDGSAAGECFADDLLERVTPQQLRAGGVLDTEYGVNREVTALERTVAEAWTDAQLACTDFVAESTKAQVALTSGKIDEASYAACLNKRLDDDTIRSATVARLMAEWSHPTVKKLVVAQSTCSRASLPGE